uniref:Uncharacterized protein n=1 Tax=Cacopsylla melanoneura TaxID=428564 RepID=A0A8D8ZHP3_9HEMI
MRRNEQKYLQDQFLILANQRITIVTLIYNKTTNTTHKLEHLVRNHRDLKHSILSTQYTHKKKNDIFLRNLKQNVDVEIERQNVGVSFGNYNKHISDKIITIYILSGHRA